MKKLILIIIALATILFVTSCADPIDPWVEYYKDGNMIGLAEWPYVLNYEERMRTVTFITYHETNALVPLGSVTVNFENNTLIFTGNPEYGIEIHYNIENQ